MSSQLVILLVFYLLATTLVFVLLAFVHALSVYRRCTALRAKADAALSDLDALRCRRHPASPGQAPDAPESDLRLAAARRNHAAAVYEYNRLLGRFPARLYCRFFGLSPCVPLHDSDAAEAQLPQVGGR